MKHLKILVQLFSRLEENGVKYCHWKSNDHVEEGLCGITDLDILVDTSQYSKMQQALAVCGFKRGVPGFSNSLPGVEGYIGLDFESGRLAYVHLHYHIVLGRNRIKEFNLRWNEQILQTRVFNKKLKLYTIDPDTEIMLLLARAATKIRTRDIILQFAGKLYFDSSWEKQYKWLLDHADKEKSIVFCKEFLGDKASKVYAEILKSGVSLKRLRVFKCRILKKIALNGMYGPVMAHLMMWGKEIFGAASYVNRRFLGTKLPIIRKISSSGGAMIVFIGSDGSGKSTQTRRLGELLSWKLDVLHVYLGAGDGSSSLLRWGMKQAQIFLEKHGIFVPQTKIASIDTKKKSLISSKDPVKRGYFYWLAKTCWAIVLSYEKQSKLKRAWRARNRGKVVIVDRYPQTAIEGFNDGPLLGKWLDSNNVIMKLIARWERIPYCMANDNPPDMVIRLNVSLETALKRDPEMTSDFLKKRSLAVGSFVFPSSTQLVEIDANSSVDNVFIEVCKKVWKVI